ncbi:uncharacterized protein [Setaria viridis]|uniref:uncharacterized protein n=1 Tax=Setaria viridis TaxID=4556 RepID=UPI003B3A1FA6
MKIPPGYSSISLELNLPGGDGERTLGDALHGIILWRKRYIIIPGKEASLLYLRDLPNKDVETIRAIPSEQQMRVIGFMQDTRMSLAEVLGQVEPLALEPIVPKWPIEIGKPLVRPKLVRKLFTKIYEFHEWYMEQSADKRHMFGLRVKPIDFFGEGEKVLRTEFKNIYEVYHKDALDVSRIITWVL